MNYSNVCPARFVRRPNRFVAEVETEEGPLTVHVKNTGRCRELLVPGARVWLTRSDNPLRKTAYDLIAVEKGARLINMDANAPNAAFGEFAAAGRFLPGMEHLRREVTYGASRFDFAFTVDGVPHYAEVKGVTLEDSGRVYFPDAPTLRGVKHLHELMGAKQAGLGAHLIFVIQMENVTAFSPNDSTHPAFGEALRQAVQAGVDVRAYCCAVTPDSMVIDAPVPLRL